MFVLGLGSLSNAENMRSNYGIEGCGAHTVGVIIASR
jgi:hypothetical protein